eukprot:TRINITY_DN73840_c0_g1_i1.p1 TRINITY_DN73840_c0_g1~~TRINITY_DN73840_c0_g1_i1.p1  ORF type:complete len:1800 (+),score=403.34 TRINITY_DN73840_c0_g1_i1:624-5402(+)
MALHAALDAERKDNNIRKFAVLAAERALEWICSTSTEASLPSKLKEPREVDNARKAQENRNVAFQTKALLLGGKIDSIFITRIEKLGFSRARAIQALAEAPDNKLLPAVRALLSDFLPLDLPYGTDLATVMPSTFDEFNDEAMALKSMYGEEAVRVELHDSGDMELSVSLPPSGVGGGSGCWKLVVLVVHGHPYPFVAPFLCPRHDRLRDANRTRLMAAMGKVCREVLGAQMLVILCEWLQENGAPFLVHTGPVAEDAVGIANGAAPTATLGARTLAMDRALQASQQEKEDAEKTDREKASRVEFLKALNATEATKPKDKFAVEIRGSPTTAHYDLSGYDDKQAQQLVKEAFETPLSCESMVRITFVVGGGKDIRGKYTDSLPKAVASALQELGFRQESGASCDLESAGSFKGQHDKGKNQKVVHIFPRIVGKSAAARCAAPETTQETIERLSCASWDDFVEEGGQLLRQRDARSKVEALASFLSTTLEELKRTDAALQAGCQISEAQRRRYDELGGPEEVAERLRWITSRLQQKPGSGGDAGGTTGEATLSFDAPSRLKEAARHARPTGAAECDQGFGSDEDWLRRRIAQTKAESTQMQSEFNAEKPLKKVRESLPSYAMREEIQRGVREHQVVLIEGETGCGKSTQLPQFIMEDWVARGEGAAVNIIMTQPRRISAIGVSERIADEMNTRLGDLCGYSIRLESKRSHRTKILVCTTGVLLRRLETDASLRGVTHIVVDECHERDLDTDFLLIIIRDLLPKRPQLRIVLMSATINAQIFKDYFEGCLSFHIPGRTFPVTSYFLEHALQHTGFVIDPNSEYCRKDLDPYLMPREEQELEMMYQKEEYQELVGGTVSPSVIQQLMRTDPEKINFDLVAAVVRHIHRNVDPPQHGKSLGAILVFVPGLGEIKKTMRALSEEPSASVGKGKDKGGKNGRDSYRDSWNTSKSGWDTHNSSWNSSQGSWDTQSGWGGSHGGWDSSNTDWNSSKGGWESSTGSWNSSKGSGGGKGGGVSGVMSGTESSKDGLWVLPLHSMISVTEQRLVFNKPPQGCRKVVVTTNIAETSITIDDVEYVVDCGRHKQTKYDPQNRVSMLVDCVETKANARQRRGRAGRVKAGVCYHLLNVRKWCRLDNFEKPEMLRVPLDSLCLRVSLMGMGHPAKVLARAITPPSDSAVLSSLQQLVELSAVELRQKVDVDGEKLSPEEAGAEGWTKAEKERLLNDKLRLTALGNHLAQLPVDAGCGKLLVLGCIFGVPRDVCTLAAGLSMKSPFAVSVSAKGGGKGDADKKKLELAKDLESDQLLLVKLFEQWEDFGKDMSTKRTWCRQNNLDMHTFETVADMRRHLIQVLVEQGFASYEQTESAASAVAYMPAILSSISSAKEEFNRRRHQLLRTLLCAALWPNVMLRNDDGSCFAKHSAVLKFHPSSVLALQVDQNSQNNSGDWNCPQCDFFNFASREECRRCSGPKPPPGQKPEAKALRHQAFMFGEKTRSLATKQGQKSETLCRNCSGVPLKALYLLGHRVQVDYFSRIMSCDGWIHCHAAPRDASMLLGLRRRLQDVLTRRLSRKAADPLRGEEDAEVINVMTSILVLDVE